MQHVGSTSRASSGGNTNSREESSGVVTRKGPWMAEEDEILLEYVRKHGPRDWSSIRSKGLLPRTGKSCRLRWVNKLKPDLKTGCKFSPEEERIVIDLQGRFGNKWARIATYLPGRTDNDVKNFWSTRQKRLARLLQTPMLSKSSKNYQGKLSHHVPPTFEVASLDLIPIGEEYSSSSGQCSHNSWMDHPDTTRITQMPILENQVLMFNMDPTLPLLEPTTDQESPRLHFDHLPNLEFDFPLLEGPHQLPSYADMTFTDHELGCQDGECCMQLPESLPFFSLQGVGERTVKREEDRFQAPDSLFDEFPTDFPTDMFDHLDLQPASSA